MVGYQTVHTFPLTVTRLKFEIKNLAITRNGEVFWRHWANFRMFDIDCGIQPWYFKPSFYMKVCYLGLSAAAFIYLCVLCSMTTDIFYSKLEGTAPQGKLAIATTIFLILAIVPLVILYFKVLPNLKIVWIAAYGVLVVILLALAFTYAGKYSSEDGEYQTYLKGLTYIMFHGGSKEVQYFYNKVKVEELNASDPDFYENHREYFDNRNTGASETIFGIFLPWLVLHVLMLVIILTSSPDYSAIDNTPIDSSATKFG